MAVGWRKLSSAIASEQEPDETGTICTVLNWSVGGTSGRVEISHQKSLW